MKQAMAGFAVALQLVAFANRPQSPEEEGAFARAIAGYVALHHAAAAGLSSPAGDTGGAAAMSELAQRIRGRRQMAQPGEILGPIAARIRGVVRTEMAGPRGASMRAAIEESNVHGIRLRVNRRYPPGLPRPTVPGQLLAQLPPLPPELEYRILGRSLMLIDSRAQIVVDFLPDVLPSITP